jgi:precorrin-2 methylase
VTLLIVAITAIVALLVIMRLTAKLGTTGSSARTTRNRRTGGDRRRRPIRVPFERRKQPRRLEDVASDYVARIEPESSTHRSVSHRT